MVTDKTIKKLIAEKRNLLKMEEKAYVNSEYSIFNSARICRIIKAEAAYIISLLFMFGTLRYLILYIEMMGVAKLTSTYQSLSIIFGLATALFLIISFYHCIDPKDEQERIQELEDWIMETTKKRK